MGPLVSLSVRVDDDQDHLAVPFGYSGTGDLPCHEQIQYISLWGKWLSGIALNVEMFPTNLTKFTLLNFKLEQDPMSILERLPSIRILRLWDSSYIGGELTCSAGGCPCLQKLEICFLLNLCCWDIKDGAMPALSHLKIYGCFELRELPELQKLPTLRHLIVHHPSGKLYDRMQSADSYKIKHIPSVHSHKFL
jgi:hypothetical protein